MQSGTSSQTQKPWVSLIFEDSESNQLSCSVPQDIIPSVYNLGLRKGDMCLVDFLAVSRADGNSYVMLQSVPRLASQEDAQGFDY